MLLGVKEPKDLTPEVVELGLEFLQKYLKVNINNTKNLKSLTTSLYKY